MIVNFVKCWFKSEDGVAAVEAALVFPILLTLLLGLVDLGNGILANQKAIRASQVAADLIARSSVVDTSMIDDALDASELAFQPFDTTTYGVDVVSVSFDDDANPVIEWRETRNMTPLADVEVRVEDLAQAGEGVLVVAVEYQFEPMFAGFLIEEIPMQEIAFARGRQGAVIERN
ncbi:MAG TPA: TadE/TadG family type IV pilus assembly protein [Alphaproteobacteria bacterium]|nr:pilus assembly protein [Alphaproteobacteria bacterium]USO05762.1 MAG: pilus assembly protein [Rhodospirillales bacterium]HOO81436.1 TadE/TadG family type IV pilus assembly protein [Alphaproteobacteria bacterium]